MLNLYQSDEHHAPLTGDSLRTNLIELSYHKSSVTEPHKQLQKEVDGDGSQVPWAFCHLPAGSVLVEASLGAEFGPSYVH